MMKPKSIAEKMAEFIVNSPIDFCEECCADHKACNEIMNEQCRAHLEDKDYLPPLPPKSHCIESIVKFFEQI